VENPTEAKIEKTEQLATRRGVLTRHLGTAASVALIALGAQLTMTKKANALYPPCFLKGTRISTSKGECAVEDLVIGDLLPTAFGGMQAVKWIGHYRYTKSRPDKNWPSIVRPVRVAASALAPNVPSVDLYVSQGHCLLIDDVLVPAGSLVNDSSICLVDPVDQQELTYFHIKLEGHEVVYAAGTPCETLLNVDETAQNFAEYFRRYGEPAADERSCAPRIYQGAKGEIVSRLRSALSPWMGPTKIDSIRGRVEARA
jgi:hypothetical protein